MITGGNGGIGLGLATGIARSGGSVAIWARNPDKNAEAIAALRAMGVDADAFVCDTSDESSVDATMAATLDRFGKCDSLFANAGTTGNGSTVATMSTEEWRRVMSVNLDGVFLCLRAAAQHLIERHQAAADASAPWTGGSLVAVSSTSAVHGAAGNAAYGAGKTALLGLVRAMAVEMARYRVRVNALVPGWTVTELAGPAYENEPFREVIMRRTPVRRWAQPDEFNTIGAYLADPSLSYHTGDDITIDGGYTVF